MRLTNSAIPGDRKPRFHALALIIAGSTLLAACASSGGGSGGGLAGLFGGSGGASAANNSAVATVDTQKFDPNYFLKSGYCPPVQVLPGTEAMTIYDKGHDGEAAFIRTQGSIAKTARECHALDASTLLIKLGVAGRILAGPKGGAGTVNLPIRIAVARQHDNSVVFSKSYTVTATLAAPDYASDYSAVFDQVQFKVNPDDRDLIVYVGFDEGKPKDKAGT